MIGDFIDLNPKASLTSPRLIAKPLLTAELLAKLHNKKMGSTGRAR